MNPCLGYIPLKLAETNAQLSMFKKTGMQPEPNWLSPKALCLKGSKSSCPLVQFQRISTACSEGKWGGGKNWECLRIRIKNVSSFTVSLYVLKLHMHIHTYTIYVAIHIKAGKDSC